MECYQMEAGKCLEFSKKMAVLRKLVRLGLISENEYILAKNKIQESELLSNWLLYWGKQSLHV